MRFDSITERQLQNFILNQIEKVFMLEKGLYENNEDYGYQYDYSELRQRVKNDELPKGYYKLCKDFGQESERGVSDE